MGKHKVKSGFKPTSKATRRKQKKQWNHIGKVMQKKVAPAVIRGIGQAVGNVIPGGFLAEPAFNAAAKSARAGNAKAFKRITPQKYFQQAAWAGLGIGPIPGANEVTRGLIESGIHGNTSHLNQRVKGVRQNYRSGTAEEQMGINLATMAL